MFFIPGSAHFKPSDMPRQTRTGKIGLTSAQRLDDRAVVLIGARLPIAPPGRKEKSRACDMKLVDTAHQAGHAARRKDQPVKPAVGGLPFAHVLGGVAVAGDLFGLAQDGGGDMRRGVTQSQNLEAGPHIGHLAQLGGVEIGDAKAASRLALGQTLRLQDMKGLAHGNMAAAELSGDVILPQTRARGDPARDYAFSKHTRNTLRQRFIKIRFCGGAARGHSGRLSLFWSFRHFTSFPRTSRQLRSNQSQFNKLSQFLISNSCFLSVFLELQARYEYLDDGLVEAFDSNFRVSSLELGELLTMKSLLSSF